MDLSEQRAGTSTFDGKVGSLVPTVASMTAQAPRLLKRPATS
jgi:hypothetical protein